MKKNLGNFRKNIWKILEKYLKFEPKIFYDISQSAAPSKHHKSYGKSFKKFDGGGVGWGGVACLIIVSTPGPDFFKFPALKSLLVVGWGGVACLIIVSTPGPDFVKVKARFGQVSK